MPLDHEREKASRYPIKQSGVCGHRNGLPAAGSVASDAPSCQSPLTGVGFFGYDNDL